MIITVQRQRLTKDGIFGNLTIDSDPFNCFTCENREKAMPAGDYELNFTYSHRFQRVMPHVVVPVRDKAAGGDAGIRIHSANFPGQLEGCIAVGDRLEDDAIDDSRETFVKLMKVIQNQKDLRIIVKDIIEGLI